MLKVAKFCSRNPELQPYLNVCQVEVEGMREAHLRDAVALVTLDPTLNSMCASCKLPCYTSGNPKPNPI